MKSRVSARKAAGGEDGFVLVAVLFMAAMILVMLAIAAPKVAADIERDREIELHHRGMQYVRGIKLYYKKFGAYPPNMEALEKSNEIRFLRKRYKDPTTGKDDWKLIHYGENKLPTAYGFFGQPLGGVGGSSLAGIGPGGSTQSPGGGLTGSGIGFGQGNGSIFGSSQDPTGASGTTGANGTTGSPGAPTDPNAPAGGAGGSIFGNNNNLTLGGGGIIGVESTTTKATILEYKKKQHFNEWEFVYDPRGDRSMQGAAPVATPTSGIGNGGYGTGAPGFSGGGPPPVTTPQQPQTPVPPQ